MPNEETPLERLVRRLDLEPQGPDTFLGRAGPNSATDVARIFGGLVIAQSIMAAGRSSATGDVHSVQQVFLRPGKPGVDLTYRVTPTFQGRTFASVNVQVSQDEQVISQAIIGLAAVSYTHLTLPTTPYV